MTVAARGVPPKGISVVIATLGGPTLKATVEALNRSTIVPGEILVCMPTDEAARGLGFSFPNVRVVQTRSRGQVAQRLEGFRQVNNDLVMQLDDDMTVDSNCIEYLSGALQDLPNAAVAPALIDSGTNRSVYRVDHGTGMLRRTFDWLMNGTDGYKEGCIQRSGSPVGIVLDENDTDRRQVEWLAGGCVMHHRSNLILQNYFPFAGKAHCEDIIHSHWLVVNGVRLLVDPRARCSLEVVSPFDRTPLAFLRDTYRDFVVRRYFMQLTGRAGWRMYLYYVLIVLRYADLSLRRMLNGIRNIVVGIGADNKRPVD